MSMNKVILVGRITRDLELRKTQTGKSVLNFNVAVNREFNKDFADFINCVAWDQTAEFMSNYLGKGSLISVEGSITTGSYEDANGKKVFTTDVSAYRVQSLGSKSDNATGNSENVQNMYKNDEPVLDITADDLPF